MSEMLIVSQQIHDSRRHGDPQKEHISEETSEEVILVKDKNGKLIGFEVLNYLSPEESKDLKTLLVESAILT